jgi:hypothetical protein
MSEEVKTDEVVDTTDVVDEQEQASGVDETEENEVEVPEGQEGEESQETEGAEEPEEDPEPFKPRRSKRSEKIGKLTKQNKELLENEAQRKAEARLRGDVDVTEKPVVSGFNEPRPKISEFDTDEDFHEAMYTWAGKKQKAEDDARTAKTRADKEKSDREIEVQATERSVTTTFLDEVAESKIEEKYSDFKEKVEASQYPRDEKGRELRIRVMSSDAAPELAYYLANNPDKILDLYEMSAEDQIRTIVTFEQSSQKKTKRQSKAPPPIKPVTGDDVPKKDVSKMSPKEYIRMRNKRQFGVEFG